MVFCNTMPSCQAVEFALRESELPVVMYNGDMTVEGRQQSMREFVDGDHEEGTAVVMVCTDLAARGLDFGGGDGGGGDGVHPAGGGHVGKQGGAQAEAVLNRIEGDLSPGQGAAGWPINPHH